MDGTDRLSVPLPIFAPTPNLLKWLSLNMILVALSSYGPYHPYRCSTLFLHHHPTDSKWCLSMSKSLLDLTLTLHTSFGYFWTLLNTPKALIDNLQRSCPILAQDPNSTQLLLWLHFFLQVNTIHSNDHALRQPGCYTHCHQLSLP